MPKRKVPADSGAQTTSSRKTAKIIAQRKSRQTSPAPLQDPKSAVSKSLLSHTWNSLQDDIVVNSVEVPTRELTGVEHYRYQLNLRRSYKEVHTNDNMNLFSEFKKPSLPDIDDQEQHGTEEEQRAGNEETNYSKAPTPPSLPTTYLYQIYTCMTTNPAIFLAIIRIAQRNLPFINFQSALNHLPNLAPTSPLPRLQSGILAEDIPHTERKGLDCLAHILFLPMFYDDDRHALGYYIHSGPVRAYTPSSGKIRIRDAKNMLFTPCTQEDLDMYGLVTYHPDVYGTNVMFLRSVGVKGGRWLGSDTVESLEEWREAFYIVAHIWEERVETAGLVDLNL